MHKTTIYLSDEELASLKARASKEGEKSFSQLIREGIQLLLKTKVKKQRVKNSFLKKIFKEKATKCIEIPYICLR